MKILEKIKDVYLTRKTGHSKRDRDFIAWRTAVINERASTVNGYQGHFCNFKHIIVVDSQKFFNHSEPFGWVPVKSFNEFCYPQKGALDDCCLWLFDRGEWRDDGLFHLTEFGGDVVFVATNNDDDAVLISLRYS